MVRRSPAVLDRVYRRAARSFEITQRAILNPISSALEPG